MATIEELKQTAIELGQALDAWEQSGYDNESLIQNAVSLHARLAPVFDRLFGALPIISTDAPPYLILQRERDLVRQAIGALDGGLVTQAYLDAWEQQQNQGSIEGSLSGESGLVESLRQLADEGSAFTYSNFSKKGEYGYPNELSPTWVSWTARVQNAVEGALPVGSSARAALAEGLKPQYLGNDEGAFLRGRSLLLGSIQAAIDLVKDGSAASQHAYEPEGLLSRRVFIVHGHDEAAKNALEGFLTEIGLEPIVLHRQADQGRTIIEKFEAYSDVGFAFVLLTPDEIAYVATEADRDESERTTEKRARPNVIFEFGYFVGKLGRDRVCCIYTGGVEVPSDISGLLYKRYEQSVDEVRYELVRELEAAGYHLL